jgi:pantoate--beta-alanine ligase
MTGGPALTGPATTRFARTRVVRTRADLAPARAALPGRVAAVFTMGALHEGHASNLRIARGLADSLIVTIFVNPLQFGPTEDLDRYPRTFDADLALCEREGVDVVFAPARAEVYPGDPAVTVSAGVLGDLLEGAVRPGHFDGVLTVVLKLLHLTRPDVTVFGQKDAQQLALVRRMVADLDVPVEVVAGPTVREPDGLALSSRNRYLAPADRARALALSRALAAGAAAGRGGVEAVLDAARRTLVAADLEPDYLVLVDPETFGEPPDRGDALLAVAARVGTTRLIDNAPVRLGKA